ncbi:ABC transporter substrate-binding protein [Paenibacillus cymbidii]|uniref:ABC transporter substrate-binding protein n=1 Tax=Paenibacillus cymbidii TaxID=1639034 RepID=UPI001081DA89|nr:ABC transporter substrate-binding protein [Paenibacillus cymbidii]
MKKTIGAGLAMCLVLALAACGSDKKETNTAASASPSASVSPAKSASPSAGPATSPSASASASPKSDAKRTLSYLGKDYTVPAKAEKLVITGSLEAMEDALVLGIKPIGGISVGGKFPAMFKDITGATESIGEKTQPNLETILKLKPEVILGTTKFPQETTDNLGKIATTIPVSHIASNWEANLLMLGDLTGTKDKAQAAINGYKADLAAAKTKLGDAVKSKKVAVIRIRSGSINIYPADVFYNPSLYADLGFAVPSQLTEAKAQQVISLEKFSEMNPDYLFVQFSEEENAEAPKALETLQSNPIWKSINAVKTGKVFVNVVDPLAQGGTAWSKINFLKAAVDKLVN